MNKYSKIFICGVVISDLVILLSYTVFFNFMDIGGVILNLSKIFITISPLISMAFWVLCYAQKIKE